MSNDMNTLTAQPNNAAGRNSSLVARAWLASLSVFALLYSGCAMCCGQYDYHYPTFGGAVQRADPTWGRVGSLYSDPGPFGGPSADYNLAPIEGSTDTNVEYDDNNNDETGDLEPLGDDPSGNLESFGGDADSSEVLPPPNNSPPQPDETSLRRLRNQSRRAWPRWR